MRPAITTRHARPRLVVAAILFASAAPLAAQTVPVPTLPEPAPPAEEPPPPAEEPPPGPAPKKPRAEPAEAAPAAERPRPQPWEYRLGVGVVRDNNVDFVADRTEGTAVVPTGGLARNLSSARGTLRIEAAGRWVGYPDQDVLDRSYFDGGLEGEYRPSTQTTWRGDVHYWLGYTDSSPTLVEQGVALPMGKSGTLSGQVDLDRKLGARTFLHAEGRILRIDFDDPAYIDGQSLRGTVSLGRQLGARDATSVAYALERMGAGEAGESYLTHYGSLQWTRTLSPRSAVLLEAGASYTANASAVGLGGSAGFYGGATFLRQIGRSSLTLYLRREVAPAFGFGVNRLETRAGLRADVPLGRDWTLSLDAYHIEPDTPEGEAAVFASSSDAAASLDRRLGRHFTLSGEARYRRRGEGFGGPPVSAFQGGLYLVLGNARQ